MKMLHKVRLWLRSNVTLNHSLNWGNTLVSTVLWGGHWQVASPAF